MDLQLCALPDVVQSAGPQHEEDLGLEFWANDISSGLSMRPKVVTFLHV